MKYQEIPPVILPPARTPPKRGREDGRYPSDPDGAKPPTARLGSLISTTSKTLVPSDIAKDAYYDLDALPYDHLLQNYAQVAQDFCEYLDLCEQKGFMVHGFDYANTEFHTHFLEYENRWAPGRRRELSEKLDRLEYWFELQADRPVTMITLTSYHKGYSIQEQWDALSRSRGKLLKLLAFYFDSPDYFWVVEPHKSGYVHFHLAVFADVSNNKKDKYGEGIEDKFRRLWSKKYKTGNHTYGLTFSQKMGDAKIRGLKRYLSKYLQKGFLLDKWTPAMLVFNACLWDTGFRMYGASKTISHIMNIKEEKQNKIVWLETKIQDVKKDHHEDGSEYTYEEERVVWYRRYIPGWFDSLIWQERCWYYYECDPLLIQYYEWIGDDSRMVNWCHLEFTRDDPEKTYLCEWGRPLRDLSHPYDPTYGVITHINKYK